MKNIQDVHLNTRVLISALLIIVAGLVISCSPSSDKSQRVVEIFADSRGIPQCSYSGPGVFSHSYGIDTFRLKVGTQIQLSGVMVIGESNEVQITVRSDATIPFSLVFKGFATTNDPAITQAQAYHQLLVESGKHEFTNNLFLHYTFERSPAGSPAIRQ
jgi:hypothetical protein